MESISLTAWAMAVGALLLHGASLAIGDSPTSVVGLSHITIASLLVVAVLSTALAYPIYFHLIGAVGPVRTNLVAYVVPVFAALTGWLLLGEPVSFWTAVGFLVVVAGFALVERETIRDEFLRIRRRGRDVESQAPSPHCDD
jgi:drug/metabolite transporter (DMT)-like permease